MIYPFDKLMNNLFAIEINGRVYGLLMEMSVAHITEQGKVLSEVYLLDEDEIIISRASMSFSETFKSFKAGGDPLENLLVMLADKASKTLNVNLQDTFKEIKKELKENK